MTNEEMINALRNCGSTSRDCGLCFYKNHPVCNFQMAIDAADALEAAGKRIAELEKQAEHTDQVDAMNFAMHLKQVARIAELEAQLPKRGEWIKYNNPNYSPFDDSGEYLYQCNKCGKVVIQETNYCPNCGARMDGAE